MLRILQIWRFNLTISSYVLSLSRANEYTWVSDLRYHINFKWSTSKSNKIEEWIYNNIATLPFSGKHKKIEWCRAGYGIELKEDVIFILCSFSEYVNFVVDFKTEKLIFGSIAFRNIKEY